MTYRSKMLIACIGSKIEGALVVVYPLEWPTWVRAIRVQFHLVRKRKINEEEAGVGPFKKIGSKIGGSVCPICF